MALLKDWRYAAEQFVERLVHRSECNTSKLTFDGVDLMGERLTEEVGKQICLENALNSVLKQGLLDWIPSILLHLQPPIWVLEDINSSRSFVVFLSSREVHPKLHTGLLGDLGSIFSSLMMIMESLLSSFGWSALHSFKRRVAYANANYGHVVGWRTSSICLQHELPKYNLLVNNEKYPHIVHVDQGNTKGNNSKTLSMVGTEVIDLEEEMIRGLTQIPWERIDVSSFQKSTQRYVAHNTIQVNRYWINSYGADVVQHMMDNFIV